MEIRYVVVDVFTDRPLAGNALCVVLDAVPDPVQPAIAREVNLSETSFPVVVSDDEYDVRIYTPAEELPFAGHPTLGTATVLGERRWTQHSPGASIAVEVTGSHAVMTQPRPEIRDVDPAPFVDGLGIAGADCAVVGTVAGISHVAVLIGAPIDRLEPALPVLARAAAAAGASGIAAVRRLNDRELHVRVFVPGVGIPEDPGTGSAAGIIAVTARQQWVTDADVTVHQGIEIGRRCRIEVHADPADLRVGGDVARCAEGAFLL